MDSGWSRETQSSKKYLNYTVIKDNFCYEIKILVELDFVVWLTYLG